MKMGLFILVINWLDFDTIILKFFKRG